MMAVQAKKNPMPTQPPEVRAHNFEEVATGYTREIALAEAQRCLNCKHAPCISGCPVNINIPGFIGKMKDGDFAGAVQIILQSSSLPAVCGRVCPQETQCEAKCTMGIKFEPVAIGRLERYAADWYLSQPAQTISTDPSNGRKVAIVGSGPSGLTCAGDLARLGYSVTVYEALHRAGGVLVYGIPEFRLPKSIVAQGIETLRRQGVNFETNVIIGKTLTVDELFEKGFDAVYIASGAGLPMFTGIPGESLNGVYSANEFLTRANLMQAYRENPVTPIMKGGKVAVIGGGNVAMDAARTALRLGAKQVNIVYRRSMEELPARREEVEHATEEGIIFNLLTAPIEILGFNDETDARNPKNGFVTGMRCQRMELGEQDAGGRRRPIPIPDSSFVLEADTVILAIGTTPNPLIKNTTEGLEVNKRGGIIVNDAGLTSRENVYAGGDAVTGTATVITAMGAGKRAAKAIDAQLRTQ